MRRYRVTLQVSVIVRADDEEHAIGHALENVHDSTVSHVIDVEEVDDCSTKPMHSSRPSARS